MAIPQVMTDAMNSVDQETNNLAARVDAMIAKINTSMPEADVNTVVSQLQLVSDRLKGLAHDPNNPVPTPTPVTP